MGDQNSDLYYFPPAVLSQIGGDWDMQPAVSLSCKKKEAKPYCWAWGTFMPSSDVSRGAQNTCPIVSWA